MARKSPRSRRRSDPAPSVPKSRRPRATPGRARASRPARPGAKRHAPKGARPAPSTARRSTRASQRARQPARKTASRSPRRPRFTPPDPARVAAILATLEGQYPEATTALDFGTPLQLLIATILSAQCTDQRVNQVTPGLFRRYPDAAAFASANRAELESLIRSTGFFRNKAKAISSCCKDIVEKHGGQVPQTLEELTALHGVGRKTANVVLGNAFGIPGLVVDTHVGRLARRLALTAETDAVKVEFALMEVVPRDRWTVFSHWLILHGRRICVARKPRCSICPLAPSCPRVGVAASQ